MRTEVVYSSSNDPREAHQQIKEKLRTLDIKPNFLFLFLTAGTWKSYEDFNRLLESYFPDTKMLGCIVEGYIAEDEIWTRGVSILLAEFEGEVEVFWAKEDLATETVEKLGDKIGTGWDSILLMFPAFYFPGKLEVVRAFLTDKWRYSQYTSKNSIEEKKEILDEYSKYLESKFVFPIDKTLKIIAEKTGKGTPIIGMNLINLENASHTPLILANYKNVGMSAAAMCYKGEVNSIFHDVFPPRGGNFKESTERIKNHFSTAEEVELVKKSLAVGEVNGLKPVDFLEYKRSGYKSLDQDELIQKVEKGKLEVATPYGLALVSQKTNGIIWLGLIDYPINLYPSFFTLDYFYDTAVFCGEIYRGGINVIGKILEKKMYNNGFDLFIIDQYTIMSFGGDVQKLLGLIRENSKSCLGIFAHPPSAYIPTTNSNYMSEVDYGIFINLTGTSTILEFK